MRNVAFSILLFALALVQIAVVSAELSRSPVQTAAAQNSEFSVRHALASTETERKTTTF